MLRDAVERLQQALSEEFDRAPKLCTLATVDERGDPAARTVVCRRVLATGDVYVVSDSRSDKVAHVRRRPAAEIVFWLPTRRQQFRAKAEVSLVEQPQLRAAFWRELSDSSRAAYFWPQPGTPRAQEGMNFPNEIGPDTPPPEAFVVLLLRLREIEFLDLKPHPHDRRRWQLAHDWQEERLNP